MDKINLTKIEKCIKLIFIDSKAIKNIITSEIP